MKDSAVAAFSDGPFVVLLEQHGTDQADDGRVSSSAQMRETSDLEMPSTPSALTRSSTLRVDTPWTEASCPTASSACSARRRGCRSDGKHVPGLLLASLCVSFRQKELTGRCTMALDVVYAAGLTEFHHVRGL